MTTFNYEDWEDRIIAYINGKMSATDRQVFESNMAEMPELREAVEFDTMLKSEADEHFLTEYVKANWDDIIPDTQKKPVPDTPKPKEQPIKHPLSIRTVFGGLGLVVFTLLAGYFIYNYLSERKEATRIENLKKEWFPPLAYDNTNLDNEAIKLYNEQKYEQAELIFSQNDNATGKNEDGAYGLYRAINALMIEPPKTDIALDILKKRHDLQGETFKSDAITWYLVLAYIQKKDFDNAQKILQTIPTTSEYFEKAKQLQEALKN